jgi:hypothetical protein
MTKSLTNLGEGSVYEPSQADEMLWWLATAEKELIADCVVDRNRYRIIGASVAATWIFATLAWTYFFMTAVESTLMAILAGMVMGFVILSIDRALIKGITRFNKNKISTFLFRGLLAATIGTFMAQPAILYLFDKEIRMQTSLDNEQRRQAKHTELVKLYADRREALEAEQIQLQNQLKQKDDAVSQARKNFLAETDGTGGSGKVGISNIALTKRAEYQKLELELQDLKNLNQPKLDSATSRLARIDADMKAQEALFDQLLADGFLTRMQALQNLMKNNDALAFRYYLIVMILMLIELMPLIAKSMLPTGTYEEKVRLREELEKEMALDNIRSEKEMKQLFNRMAREQDESAIRSFFDMTREERHEKMQQFGKQWRDDPRHSFDGYWERIKRDVLTKQEY